MVHTYILIMLISGYNVNKQINALLTQGCVDFIQKPFQIRSLHNKIRAALDRKIKDSNRFNNF